MLGIQSFFVMLVVRDDGVEDLEVLFDTCIHKTIKHVSMPEKLQKLFAPKGPTTKSGSSWNY